MGQSIRLGAFVLISLVILSIFVFLVGTSESKFQSNYRLQAQFQNVSGLEDGADVRVGGLHAGTVRNINLPWQPDGRITVVMDLSTRTRSLVKQDSMASIKSEGLVGNKYVEISFGTVQAGQVPNGGTIESVPPLDISNLMAKTDQILDSTKSALDNLQFATGNVSAITSKINSGRGTIGALVNDKSVYQQASAGVSALREDADALKHNFLLRGYFNKRGFADAADIQKHAIARLPEETPERVFTLDATKLFDKLDSAKLKNEKAMNEAGTFIEARKPALVVIGASTGPKGDADEARELSQARAYAVRGYLLDHYKLQDASVKIIGIGKSDGDASVRILVYAGALKE
jgi:phospholipid/cholesterol/gamma-HCH transport system substrate-binding protein